MRNINKVYYYFLQRLKIKNQLFHTVKCKKHSLLFFPVPKNMCSTIKQSFYYLDNNVYFDKNSNSEIDIHQYYFNQSEMYMTKSKIIDSNAQKVIIVRDPIERFVSAYRNRVIDLKDMEPFANKLKNAGLTPLPDINSFVKNIEKYRWIVPSIRHHTDPQILFLGDDLTIYDHIFDIKESDKLLTLIREFDKDIIFKREKSGGTKVPVSSLLPESLDKLLSFYSLDYKALKNYI